MARARRRTAAIRRLFSPNTMYATWCQLQRTMSKIVKNLRVNMACASQNALAPRIMVLSTSKNAAGIASGLPCEPATSAALSEPFDETRITPLYCLIEWERYEQHNESGPRSTIRAKSLPAVRHGPGPGC